MIEDGRFEDSGIVPFLVAMQKTRGETKETHHLPRDKHDNQQKKDHVAMIVRWGSVRVATAQAAARPT